MVIKFSFPRYETAFYIILSCAGAICCLIFPRELSLAGFEFDVKVKYYLV
jgi:hypothetical protein